MKPGTVPRPSYESINYLLRPAKSIERKMLCEAFRRLSEFGPLDSYRYVGFGATHFRDFSLFHRVLGITDMISIECEEKDEKRIEFNKPFRCIKLAFGLSRDILPTLSFDKKTILWLDYDCKLDSSVLSDIQLFCTRAVPGSVLVVTVNAHPDSLDDSRDGLCRSSRLEKLAGRVGREAVPLGVKEKDLAGWGMAKVCWRIIDAQIKETLTQRNGGRAQGRRIQYEQLFNFNYADGAKMLTVGGLFFEERQSQIVEKCQFRNLNFISTGESPYVIDAPVLTYRELQYLDALLPADNYDELQVDWLPRDHLESYMKLYRYYPVFTEAVL